MRNERRQNERLYYHAEMQIITKTKDLVAAHTINLSDRGMLLKCQNTIDCKVGDILNVQSRVFPEAPIKKVIVRRIPEADKIGVEFV